MKATMLRHRIAIAKHLNSVLFPLRNGLWVAWRKLAPNSRRLRRFECMYDMHFEFDTCCLCSDDHEAYLEMVLAELSVLCFIKRI